eukprot:COSAG02_NODE_340_length_24179_cov_6.401644_20_plen_145_part_00
MARHRRLHPLQRLSTSHPCTKTEGDSLAYLSPRVESWAHCHSARQQTVRNRRILIAAGAYTYISDMLGARIQVRVHGPARPRPAPAGARIRYLLVPYYDRVFEYLRYGRMLLMPLGSFISYQYNEGLASTTSHYTPYTGCVPVL